jgi:pilus assembly protein FimV
MQRLLTSLALVLALALSAQSATALGLGKVSGSPVLGQSLSFAIALRLEPGEVIEARCVKAEVGFGEHVLQDALVRVHIETATGTGERRVRITTRVPVDEPVVSIHLAFVCPTALSRSFNVFADPPGRGAMVADAAGADTWVPDRAETAVSPLLSTVPTRAASAAAPQTETPRQRRRRAGDGAPTTTTGAVRPDATTARAAARSRAEVAASRPRGPVLRLDPIEADAVVSPSLQFDTRLSPVPEASASDVAPRALDPEQAQRQQDLERLKAMEAALLKLRADSQATQKSLSDMQQRVRAAEAARHANPLVYGLAVLCVLLAAALVGMAWLRRRDRAAAAWWQAQSELLPPSPDAASAPVPSAAAPPAPRTAPSTGPDSSFSFDLTPEAPPAVPVPAAPAPSPMRRAEPEVVNAVEPRRPMSAEELIDLEQQAEFFVVLGQDDAAIDLLMGHVRSTGGVSPLPYLKLLEIYRRLGDREPYDRIRERFNRRFNAYAPEWDVDPDAGLNLEGYPEVMQRLQDAWGRPSQAMELLDNALFRRDAGPTFDVPAYRELLFLYSTARDLAERDVGPDGVDLLLPLNDDAPPTMTAVPATQQPPGETKIEHFSLDLDVSTDQPPRLSLEDPGFRRSER